MSVFNLRERERGEGGEKGGGLIRSKSKKINSFFAPNKNNTNNTNTTNTTKPAKDTSKSNTQPSTPQNSSEPTNIYPKDIHKLPYNIGQDLYNRVFFV